jgi:hypothetical protein
MDRVWFAHKDSCVGNVMLTALMLGGANFKRRELVLMELPQEGIVGLLFLWILILNFVILSAHTHSPRYPTVTPSAISWCSQCGTLTRACAMSFEILASKTVAKYTYSLCKVILPQVLFYSGRKDFSSLLSIAIFLDMSLHDPIHLVTHWASEFVRQHLMYFVYLICNPHSNLSIIFLLAYHSCTRGYIVTFMYVLTIYLRFTLCILSLFPSPL